MLMTVMCSTVWGGAPHLVTTGSQVFSKWLNGAELIKLNQFRKTVVCLTVSSYHELAIFVLGDDKMAAPVMAPLEEIHNQKDKSERQKCEDAAEWVESVSLVGQDVSDGFIAETDKKAAQSFISEQIFCVPRTQCQTQLIMLPYR